MPGRLCSSTSSIAAATARKNFAKGAAFQRHRAGFSRATRRHHVLCRHHALGAYRYLARNLTHWFPNLGFRRSHLNLFLDRYEHGCTLTGNASTGRRRFAQVLAGALPRLRPGQLLIAAVLAARERLSSNALAVVLSQLQKPQFSVAFRRQPHRVVALVRELAPAAGEARDAAALAALQHIARQFTEHVKDYGVHALPIFCSLAQAAGPSAFRRLTGSESERLISSVATQGGFRLERSFPNARATCDNPLKGGSATLAYATLPSELTESSPVADLASAEDLLCALGRSGARNLAVQTELCRYMSARIADLDPLRLPALAQALGRGEPHEDFILLHGLCRRSIETLDDLDNHGLIILLQALAKFDLYDEEFLESISSRLVKGGADKLSAAKMSDAIYALGTLQVRDGLMLDALCTALAPRARELSEADLVRCLRGLVRLRHSERRLLSALVPEIDQQKWALGPLSLSNVINALSSLGTAFDDSVMTARASAPVEPPVFPEEFFAGLFRVATARINRLTSTSVQHVLTGLCRQQGRMKSETLEEPLTAICAYLATPALATQLTPVQAIGALSALAKLRCRHLAASSVLLSALVGRGSAVHWTWAPSATFYSREPSLPSTAHESSSSAVAVDHRQPPFDESHCLHFLGSTLDTSYCVEIVQGVHRLDLHGVLPFYLCRLLWDHLLQPHLHDLRAREVVAVARAMGASQFAVGSIETESWKENVARSCIENLRRHEHYLESAWNTLLPFKLLCLEIEFGTFGCRRLSDILNPTLFGFVERLRMLSHEECEHNRLQREGVEEETSATEQQSITRTAPNVSQESALTDDPIYVDEALVVSNCHFAFGFPVDIFVEARG